VADLDECLNRLLNSTRFACEATARRCRNRASTTVDTLVKVALVGFAKQLDGRVAQADAWLCELLDGAPSEGRKAEMRDACAEWLRMLQ
jgi:hypothetical protein